MKSYQRLCISLLLITLVTMTAGITNSTNYNSCRFSPVAVNLSTGFAQVNLKPTAVLPLETTVGPQPILLWTPVPDAVYYEIEFLDSPPENPGSVLPSEHRIFASREVYTQGYNPDLAAMPATKVFWRVRGLDVNGMPVGVFSDARELQVDPTKKRAAQAAHHFRF